MLKLLWEARVSRSINFAIKYTHQITTNIHYSIANRNVKCEMHTSHFCLFSSWLLFSEVLNSLYVYMSSIAIGARNHPNGIIYSKYLICLAGAKRKRTQQHSIHWSPFWAKKVCWKKNDEYRCIDCTHLWLGEKRRRKWSIANER